MVTSNVPDKSNWCSNKATQRRLVHDRQHVDNVRTTTPPKAQGYPLRGDGKDATPAVERIGPDQARNSRKAQRSTLIGSATTARFDGLFKLWQCQGRRRLANNQGTVLLQKPVSCIEARFDRMQPVTSAMLDQIERRKGSAKGPLRSAPRLEPHGQQRFPNNLRSWPCSDVSTNRFVLHCRPTL